MRSTNIRDYLLLVRRGMWHALKEKHSLQVNRYMNARIGSSPELQQTGRWMLWIENHVRDEMR